MQVGIIKSPLLTQTLFDVYLGQNPVSPGAKSSIEKGLVNLASKAADDASDSVRSLNDTMEGKCCSRPS